MHALVVVVVVAAAACVIAVPALLLARRRVTARSGAPGPVEADLLSRLTDEVASWQAEAGYWKQTAQRLQAELDGRAAPPAQAASPPEPGRAETGDMV